MNEHILSLSNKHQYNENLAKQYLINLNSFMANFDNYNFRNLYNLLQKSIPEYKTNYVNTTLNKEIEQSLQSIVNTFNLLKIMISYTDKDLEITEIERKLLRKVLSKAHQQHFLILSRFLFNLSNKRIIKSFEKLYKLEVERKLMLEDVNNKVLSLDLANNAPVKLLVDNIITNKPQQTEDLKNIFLELKEIPFNSSETLHNLIAKLTEISNKTIPLRKKSLLELKNKLK